MNLPVRHGKGTRLEVDGCEAKVMTGPSVKSKTIGSLAAFLQDSLVLDKT